jgi:hypothetical protein
MADYKKERDVTFAVFGGPGRGWSAYSMTYNTEWAGFVGMFTVRCTSHRDGKKKAIAAAKASLAEAKQ